MVIPAIGCRSNATVMRWLLSGCRGWKSWSWRLYQQVRLTEAFCFWTGVGIQCLWADANGPRGIRGGGVHHRRCGVCELGMAFSKKVMGESPCQPRMHSWMPWRSGAARWRRPGQTGPALAPPFTAKAVAVSYGFDREAPGASGLNGSPA